MPLNPSDAQILGDIINDLNPYYDPSINSWQMDIEIATIAPGPGIAASLAAAGIPSPNTTSTPTNVTLEVDDHYYGEWNFDGKPQKISRALRIKYRYPSSTPSGQVYWVEDYLLIGFQGADGG